MSEQAPVTPPIDERVVRVQHQNYDDATKSSHFYGVDARGKKIQHISVEQAETYIEENYDHLDNSVDRGTPTPDAGEGAPEAKAADSAQVPEAKDGTSGADKSAEDDDSDKAATRKVPEFNKATAKETFKPAEGAKPATGKEVEVWKSKVPEVVSKVPVVVKPDPKAKKNWIEDGPIVERSDADKEATQAERDKSMAQLTALRDEYLSRVAGRGRRGWAMFRRKFSEKGVQQAKEAYESHRNKLYSSEVKQLNDLGISMDDINGVITSMVFSEQRVVAKRLKQMRLSASGQYEKIGNKTAFDEVAAKKLNIFSRQAAKYYNWFDRTTKGKKTMSMMGVGAATGAAVGFAGLAFAPVTAAVLGVAGGGLLANRIAKAFLSHQIKKNVDNTAEKVMTRAASREEDQLRALGNGTSGINVTRFIDAESHEDTKRNRSRAKRAMGSAALGAVFGLAGAELVEHGVGAVVNRIGDINWSKDIGLPDVHNGAVIKASKESTSNGDGPWPFGSDKPAWLQRAEGVNVKHDGYKADGTLRVPKHGGLGDSFNLEHGSGQIREIQQYAAAHGYNGIDGEKATTIWEHLKENPLTDGNHDLINTDGTHDTYNVGSDVRMSRPDATAHWGSKAMERALREELEKEAA